MGPPGPPGTNANILVGAGLTRDGDTVSLDMDYANSAFWRIGGNAGASAPLFLGTTDPQSLYLGVNGLTALRFEPAAVTNILGGFQGNLLEPGISGALLLGGGAADDGYGNTAAHYVGADYATVIGGLGNSAGTYAALVAGGRNNEAMGNYAIVLGGNENLSNAFGAAVIGGELNAAEGAFSAAMGRRARAQHSGSFVWADTVDTDFASQRANQFSVRATGGARFTVSNVMSVEIRQVDNKLISAGNGAFLSLGGTWTNASDRASKENILPADPHLVLQQLQQLPVYHWNYRAESADVLRMGPMADDFHRIFQLGADDAHISTVDVDGVLLAAVQALVERVDAADATIAAQQTRIEALEQQNSQAEARLAALEAAVAQLTGGNP